MRALSGTVQYLRELSPIRRAVAYLDAKAVRSPGLRTLGQTMKWTGPLLRAFFTMIGFDAVLLLSTGAVSDEAILYCSTAGFALGLLRGIQNSARWAERFELARTQAEMKEIKEMGQRNGKSVRFLNRKVSFLDVRIELLREYRKVLSIVRDNALGEYRIRTEIEEKISNLSQRLGELKGKKDVAMEDLRELGGEAQVSQAFESNSALVIERLNESVPHLEEEIRILKEYGNDLKKWSLFNIAGATEQKINYLSQRVKVRESELKDIKDVIGKIKREGLDPSGYEYVDYLGEGGMGIVLKAYYPEEDCFVAVKIFNLEGEEGFNRFISEAQIAKELEHPCIAKGYDWSRGKESIDQFIRKCLKQIYGEEPAPQRSYPYYTTELIRGYSLDDLLGQGGRLSPGDALDIASQILSAMEHYSAAGLVHRDLKPGNIMLCIGLPPAREGYVKLIDFGIAKITDIPKRTATGITLGSPVYMSPEQMAAEKNLDIRSDLYALGCIIYEMMTGNTLYDGLRRLFDEELHAKLSTNINDFPALVELLNSMLAYDVSERFSIEEVREGLEDCKAYVRTQFGG